MTEAVPTFSQSGERLACCCNCRTKGVPLWLPKSKMHVRVVKGRTLHYCGGCWAERQAGMAAVRVVR